jgi:hypothetical protein
VVFAHLGDMVSKGFKLRAILTAELAAMCVCIPGAGIVAMYGGYKLMIWSFGGHAEFRRIVLREPLEGNYVQANPRTVLYRETPLSAVPKHITDKPAGDAAALRTHSDF